MNSKSKYTVELNDYECELIVNHCIVFDKLKATLTRHSQKEGIHKVKMTFQEIHDIVGWLAGEANHATSAELEEELSCLYETFDALEYSVRRNEQA